MVGYYHDATNACVHVGVSSSRPSVPVGIAEETTRLGAREE